MFVRITDVPRMRGPDRTLNCEPAFIDLEPHSVAFPDLSDLTEPSRIHFIFLPDFTPISTTKLVRDHFFPAATDTY